MQTVSDTHQAYTWVERVIMRTCPTQTVPVFAYGYAWDDSVLNSVNQSLNRSGLCFMHSSKESRNTLRAVVPRVISSRGLVLPGYDWAASQVKKTARGNDRIASPGVAIMAAFEGSVSGKTNTPTWLHSHNMSEHVVRRFRSLSTVDKFPVVIKPRKGTAGYGIHMVWNRSMLPERLSGRIVEEAILSLVEWAVYFVAYRGRTLRADCAFFESRRNVTLFVRGKASSTPLVKTWRPCPDALLRMTRRLVRGSGYHGMGCVGGKTDARRRGDTPKIFEVNPRLCHVLISDSVRLGASVRTLLKRIDDEDGRRRPTAPDGVQVVLRHAQSNVTSVGHS